MSALWENFFKQEKKTPNFRAVIKDIPLFSELSRSDLASIERILHVRNYKAGETIFSQGDPGVGMFIISAGVVNIIQEPNDQLLATLNKGSFFGELSLLDEAPRSATARAVKECELLGFFQPDLFSVMAKNPKLGVKLLLQLAKIIGERLRHTNKRLQGLSAAADQKK